MQARLNPIEKLLLFEWRANLLAVPSPSVYKVQPSWIKWWSQWWIWYLFNDVIDLLAVPSSNASLAESSDKVNVVQVKWWIYWLYQVQVQPSWIKCWSQWWIWYLFNDVIDLLAVPSSNASLAESNGEVSNVWMKRWIFWRCQVQAPARLNQVIELMCFNGPSASLAESSLTESSDEAIVVQWSDEHCRPCQVQSQLSEMKIWSVG